MLISSAAWAPGFHGQNGEWERCTQDTGLALLVCNRTGPDRTLDFTSAESVVVKDEAAPDLIVESFNGFHHRLELPAPKLSDTGISARSRVNSPEETPHRFHSQMHLFIDQDSDETEPSVI